MSRTFRRKPGASSRDHAFTPEIHQYGFLSSIATHNESLASRVTWFGIR